MLPNILPYSHIDRPFSSHILQMILLHVYLGNLDTFQQDVMAYQSDIDKALVQFLYQSWIEYIDHRKPILLH